MRTAEERIERAIKLTPRRWRERYAPEWRHDLAAVSQSPVRDDIAHGAEALAKRLRKQWFARALLGQEGLESVKVWTVLLVAVAVTSFLPLFGLVMIAIVLAAIALFWNVGSRSRRSVTLMTISIVVGLSALAYTVWSIAVSVDAADTATTAPEAAQYTWVGLLALLVAAITFAGTAVWAARRARH